MFRDGRRLVCCGALLGITLGAMGCASTSFGLGCGKGGCDQGMCDAGCDPCQSQGRKKLFKRNDGCDTCAGKKSWGRCSGCGNWGSCCGGVCGCCANRSLAIQEEYPVGAVQRAHFHQMQTNGEAVDFVLFQKDFVLESAELTPDAKDKILEIAARMRSAPFPVIVERTFNNADPELDAHRRAIVAQILTDLGNPDANNRTFVSMAYGPGKSSLEAGPEFYQHTFQGGTTNTFGNNNLGGFGGGGGGGGFGGGFGGGGGGFFGF
jgi:hypothetical protein